jgi:hypothetical protein
LGGVGLDNLFGNDFVHLGSDRLLLGALSVVSFSLLVGRLFGEGDGEHSQDISVGGFTVLDGFDEGLSFFNHRAELISGHVDSVE